MVLYLFLTAAVVALDQVTKFLFYGKAATSIIGNFLWFESTLNTGIAFSIFSGKSMQIVLIVFSSIAALFMLMLVLSKAFLKNKPEKIMLALILGGTIGNIIDRIAFGGVRDFIYLKFIDFAIFNVADMFITITAIVLCIYVISHISKNKEEDD